MVERAPLLAAEFADQLRRRGVPVSLRQSLQFVEALALTSGGRLREVAAATLATTPDDLAIIDAVLAHRPPPPRLAAPPAPTFLVDTDEASAARADDEQGATGGRTSFSAIEVLRHRDLADCSDEERARIRALSERVSLHGDERRTRRTSRTGGPGPLDGRATIRASAATDAELVRLHRRARRRRPRRVVLLLDVSGSMQPYSRELLHLAYVGATGVGRVEVFALGTRLTRLTRALAQHDPDAAFDSVLQAASDWGGGTRLGATLRALNDDPTARGTVRGATVVVVSDGLDRGDPMVLGEQLARLSKVAHRLVWMNPLRASAGYEPTAGGMRAALPHVDAFVDGHSLQAFEALAALVSKPRGGR
jgi:uncharacterized protein with von Willebrand factor type A (vWA) domain